MPLDYSQKRLISTALHAKGHGKRAERLRFYAFLTGLLSTLVTVVQFYLIASGRL